MVCASPVLAVAVTVIVLVTGVGVVGCVGADAPPPPPHPVIPDPTAMKARARMPICNAPTRAFLRRMERMPRQGRIAKSGAPEEKGCATAAVSAWVLMLRETVEVPLF